MIKQGGRGVYLHALTRDAQSTDGLLCLQRIPLSALHAWDPAGSALVLLVVHMHMLVDRTTRRASVITEIQPDSDQTPGTPMRRDGGTYWLEVTQARTFLFKAVVTVEVVRHRTLHVFDGSDMSHVRRRVAMGPSAFSFESNLVPSLYLFWFCAVRLMRANTGHEDTFTDSRRSL